MIKNPHRPIIQTSKKPYHGQWGRFALSSLNYVEKGLNADYDPYLTNNFQLKGPPCSFIHQKTGFRMAFLIPSIKISPFTIHIEIANTPQKRLSSTRFIRNAFGTPDKTLYVIQHR
jgi:hypothetical protein